MDFAISEELAMVRHTVRRFVNEELRPHERAIEEADHFDADLFRELRGKAVALGLYAHNIAEEQGGGGLSMLGQVIVGEELGRTTWALGEALGYLPAGVALADDAQQDWFLGPLTRGEKTVAIALTEPDAGSDLGGIRTRATQSGGRWLLNGSKHYISGADYADYIVVIAVSDAGAPIQERFTAFIVERTNPGFHYLRNIKKMGWRGYQLGAFSLADCEVDEASVLGGVGDGFKVAAAALNGGRTAFAGRYVGTASELLEQGVKYAANRRTFGKRLADHQSIQFGLADCDCEIEAARFLVYRAASAIDDKEPHAHIAVSRAKLFASEVTGRVADRILQIFGGAGFMCDFTIERMYRDARAFRIGEGTSEMQRIQIARHLLRA